tara:strand:- start:4720 stop:5136 length:417 start_codon:yes stop_codon:yes gene_type:complete
MSAEKKNASAVTGSCLCGGVAFSAQRFDGPVVACHCTQCRKTSGHFVAATRAKRAHIKFSRDETLTWFRSSAEAERGFCNQCGGNLFWRRIDSENMSIMAGTLDAPTGLHLTRHIYVVDKGDYYDIEDGFEIFEGSDE